MPELWAALGRQARDFDGYTSFFAERVFVDDRLVTKHDSPTRVSFRRNTELWVLYRNPETDETVERSYSGLTIETSNRAVAVSCPFDGEYHKIA